MITETIAVDFDGVIHTARDARQVARWIEQRTGHGIECTTQRHSAGDEQETPRCRVYR